MLRLPAHTNLNWCLFTIAVACILAPPSLGGQLVDTQREVVIDQANLIRVVHGFECASEEQRLKDGEIRIRHTENVPSWAAQNVVFINGWRLRYLKGDHHVGKIRVFVDAIDTDGGRFSWEARGLIQDGDIQDPIHFCYAYTAISWNPSALLVRRVGASTESELRDDTEYEAQNTKNDNAVFSALLNRDTGLRFRDLRPLQDSVALPVGYELAWGSGSGRSAHHLLQLGYKLGGIWDWGNGYRWLLQAILKDNKSEREYRISNRAVILQGEGMRVVEPPFAIQTIKRFRGGCASSHGGVKTETGSFSHVGPFEYAIPVLSGWNLSFSCDNDEEVSDIGVWIDTFRHNRDASTLRYTVKSVLADKNAWPDHEVEHVAQLVAFSAINARFP